MINMKNEYICNYIHNAEALCGFVMLGIDIIMKRLLNATSWLSEIW